MDFGSTPSVRLEIDGREDGETFPLLRARSDLSRDGVTKRVLTNEWTGAVSGEWGDAENWGGGEVPVRDQNVVIPANGSDVEVHVTTQVNSTDVNPGYPQATHLAIGGGDRLSRVVLSRDPDGFSDGRFEIEESVDVISNGELTGDGLVMAPIFVSDGGRMTVAAGDTLQAPRVEVGGGDAVSTLAMSGGTLQTDAGLYIEDGGRLTGDGAFSGDGTVEVRGALAPGRSPGRLDFVGLDLAAPSVTFLEIGGREQGETHDWVSASGTVSLDGVLDVSLLDLGDGFAPAVGDRFDLVSAAQLLGVFDEIRLPELKEATWRRRQTGTEFSLLVEAANPVPLPAGAWLMAAVIGALGLMARRPSPA